MELIRLSKLIILFEIANKKPFEIANKNIGKNLRKCIYCFIVLTLKCIEYLNRLVERISNEECQFWEAGEIVDLFHGSTLNFLLFGKNVFDDVSSIQSFTLKFQNLIKFPSLASNLARKIVLL